MNRKKWKKQSRNLPLMATKLMEECGEIAAEIVNIEMDGGKDTETFIRQMESELDQAEYLIKQIRKECERRLTGPMNSAKVNGVKQSSGRSHGKSA